VAIGNGCRMNDEVISVGDDNVVNSLLVVSSNIEVSGKILEVKSLPMSVEGCVDIDVPFVTAFVFVTIDETVNRLFEF
jgi:hypothetical protein